MSDWISSYRLRNHLRLEYEKKIEAIEFMRQGASMVRNGEDKDLNGSIDLSIASPWIYDVLPPKSAIVPVKTKNTRESIFYTKVTSVLSNRAAKISDVTDSYQAYIDVTDNTDHNLVSQHSEVTNQYVAQDMHSSHE